MQERELSILLPVKNIEMEISGILRFISGQITELSAEILIIDMGSSDRTVFQAVRFMKEKNLHGFVLQNGDTTVSCALNAGLRKAGGEFVTFFFARRLYDGILCPYLETARRARADFVYGCTGPEEVRLAERRSRSSVIQQKKGNAVLKEVLRRPTMMDLAGILLRRDFLKEKQIAFQTFCRFGYTEEFLYSGLLQAEGIVQAPVIPVRAGGAELVRGKLEPVGRDIFQRVEALLRVLDTAKRCFGEDRELLRLLHNFKIPLTIMNCADILLREGNSSRDVKKWLQALGYDKFLSADGKLDRRLKNRILLWKTMPRLYRP